MKSSMTSIRVIYVHREREKVDFKSREVNCLKECALALRMKTSPTPYNAYLMCDNRYTYTFDVYSCYSLRYMR